MNLDGLAIGCVEKGSFICAVESDTPLDQGPNITGNSALNTDTPPFVQIVPQAATFALIPNEDMSIDFQVQVGTKSVYTSDE